MHYIRDIVLERLVLEAVSDLSDFVRCYEPVFLYLLAKKNNAMRQKEYQQLQQVVENGTKRIVDLRLVLRTLRERTDIKELTPTLVNSLIERIEVHNSDKSSGHSHVKVDIYFTAVGMIDIPTEKEILATMKEIRNNPQDFKFVA